MGAVEVGSPNVTVWRVENADRVGPYHSWGAGRLEGKCTGQHPSPEKDGIRGSVWGWWKFGFRSLDQLLDWFGDPQMLLHLVVEHFNVVKLEVPEYHVTFGGRQMAYRESLDEKLAREVVPWREVLLYSDKYERKVSES